MSKVLPSSGADDLIEYATSQAAAVSPIFTVDVAGVYTFPVETLGNFTALSFQLLVFVGAVARSVLQFNVITQGRLFSASLVPGTNYQLVCTGFAGGRGVSVGANGPIVQNNGVPVVLTDAGVITDRSGNLLVGSPIDGGTY